MQLVLPGLIVFPMLCAVVSYLIGRHSRRARDVFACCAELAVFGVTLWLLVRSLMGEEALQFHLDGFCGLGMNLRADGFRTLYACVAALMWAGTGLFSPQYFAHYRNRNRYHFFCLLTLGATLGVFLSDDLYTTFIFFEIMSFTSYTWVAHEETPGAMRAAETYLAVAVIGGMVTLMGLFLMYQALGTLSFDGMLEAAEALESRRSLYLPGALILFGFGAKGGMFPVHIWLPKAHPVAPAPASALLSGILTKTGIFGILAVSLSVFRHDAVWGLVILLLGCVTMFLGALLGLFSIDLKRTLACSSMSQIGFILVGIACQCLLGEESSLAAQGTVLHMVNHSLFKLVLFMCAGTVYMHLHKLDLNDIRGWGRRKPFLKICFLMAGLGISGIPLWSGFVSKSLLHEGILEYVAEGAAFAPIAKAVEIIFVITGGLTLSYMTKLFVAVFVEKHPTRQQEFDENRHYLSLPGKIAIGLPALLIFFFGLTPSFSMRALSDLALPFLRSHPHTVHYFSWENLLGAIKSVAVAAVVYPFIVRKWMMQPDPDAGTQRYVNRWLRHFDLEDSVYRPLIQGFLAAFGWFFALLDRLLEGLILPALMTLGTLIAEGADRINDRCLIPLCTFVGTWSAKFLDFCMDGLVVPCLVGIGTFFGRVLDSVTDLSVLGLKKTVMRTRTPAARPTVGSLFAFRLGQLLDRIVAVLNRTILRFHPIQTRFIPAVAAAEEDLLETTRYFSRTISFSLLMFAIGLLIFLVLILR